MKADEIKMEIATEPIEIRMPRFKKTRRGKKRRFNAFHDADDENPSHSPPRNESWGECDSFDMSTSLGKRPCVSDSCADPPPDGATSLNAPCNTNNGFKRLMLRPLDVPKAPNNSTQFIMDDHENCNLYLSFESPRCRRRRRSTGASCSDAGGDLCYSPCTGYQDIDYEYESPDDLDSTAFFEQDFEIIYRRAREDELVTLSRGELIGQFIEMEDKAVSYEQLLRGSLPSVAELQEELLKLQEENEILRKTNRCLMDGSGTQSTGQPSSNSSWSSEGGESDPSSSVEESEERNSARGADADESP